MAYYGCGGDRWRWRLLRLGDESNKASIAGVEIRICISLEQRRNRLHVGVGLYSCLST